MPNPYTIQFGPWSPDLQNVAVQMPYQFGATPVPSADCLNVYYADGAYRSMPAPASIGAPADSPIVNAVTWYDDTDQQEIVFAASANGIEQLIDGVWSVVPVATSITIPAFGHLIGITLAGMNRATGQGIALRLGTATVQGQIFNGIIGVGTSGNYSGFGETPASASSFGSLTPYTDINGNAPVGIFNNTGGNPGFFIYMLSSSGSDPGQSYFSEFGNNETRFYTSLASYSFNPLTFLATWQWINTTFPLANGAVALSP
jgi:hypothetical protein